MKASEIINEYVYLRDALAEHRKVYNELEKDCKERMQVLSDKLLKKSYKQGTNTFSTDTHRAFKTTKTYAKHLEGSEDLEKMHNYVLQTKDFGLFTKHIAKAHLLELINNGVNPAEIGLELVSEAVIQISKK